MLPGLRNDASQRNTTDDHAKSVVFTFTWRALGSSYPVEAKMRGKLREEISDIHNFDNLILTVVEAAQTA